MGELWLTGDPNILLSPPTDGWFLGATGRQLGVGQWFSDSAPWSTRAMQRDWGGLPRGQFCFSCILCIMTSYKTHSVLKCKSPGKSTGVWAADLSVSPFSLSGLGFLICKLTLRILNVQDYWENSPPVFSNFLLKLWYNRNTVKGAILSGV